MRNPAVRVLHEVAADLVMTVADPVGFDLVGHQQKTGILNRAAGEHIMPGLHLQFPALQGFSIQAA